MDDDKVLPYIEIKKSSCPPTNKSHKQYTNSWHIGANMDSYYQINIPDKQLILL
jgi:hypothetical protein